MILEAPAHEADAMGEERGGQCIAGIPLIRLTIESEAYAAAAINQAAGVKARRPVHSLAPTASI
jgi:hypothetical protein